MRDRRTQLLRFGAFLVATCLCYYGTIICFWGTTMQIWCDPGGCISTPLRWSAIAAQLPGRTDNEIKNHWHTNLKKRKKQNSTTTEFEEKVNLSDISPCETSKEKEILMEVPTINYSSLNPTTHQILESSPFSPQPSLSELSSSSSISTTDTAAVSSSNLVAYDNGASFETYEIFSGTFWTEPFVADSAYNITNDFMVPSVESGFLYGVYDGDDGLNW